MGQGFYFFIYKLFFFNLEKNPTSHLKTQRAPSEIGVFKSECIVVFFNSMQERRVCLLYKLSFNWETGKKPQAKSDD